MNQHLPTASRVSRFSFGLLASWVGVMNFNGTSIQAQELSGQAIYEKLCVECHAPDGRGVAKKCDEPLHGDKSLPKLIAYIDKKMPEENPELCVGPDAERVGKYIYDAFYSPAARAKLNPPKIELSRLTNRQFRESVADLFASFGEPRLMGEGKGLGGKYYASDGMNKKARQAFEREDRALEFDFGEGSPGEGIPADQFSIAWQGSLLAESSGWHEFRIRTPNGARLYLNGEFRSGDGNQRDDSDAKRQPALIDAWVSSGDTIREEVARVYLLGGRAYPLRLDYFKYKEKRGSISLQWKPPHGVWSVLKAPYISPAPASHVTLVTVSMPPDDGSMGYERGHTVSLGWHEATTKAAIEVGTEVQGRLRALIKVKEEAPEFAAKCREFIATLAERAFRRPLSDEDRKLYIDRIFTDGVSPDVAVKRATMLILKSPRFLYPELGGRDDFNVAARLALGVWDSLPDAALLDAARKGELKTPEQVRAQATRMMQDPRAKAKLRDFFEHWLAIAEADDLSKDEKEYPGFDASVVADLRHSLGMFVDHVAWSEASDYRELLKADYIFMNDRLAKFYGMTAPEGGDFHPVKFDPAQRAGIFTHPFLLSVFSYHKSSSPIHRGVFLTRNVMGRMLKPPPMAIEFMDDRFDPSLSMREKVTELTNKAACMSCHVTINPLGFSLEHFDAVGRYRTTDNKKPVNAESDYTTSDGQLVKLRGPQDLAAYTAGSEEAQQGFVRQMFHFAIKQPTAAYGHETLQKLNASFVASNFHMRNLFVEMNTLVALHQSEPPKQASR